MTAIIAAQQLARALKLAAKAREESFDSEAADAAVEAHGGKFPPVNSEQFYQLTILQACEKVCAPDLVEPVRIMLTTAWNDSLMWADNIK